MARINLLPWREAARQRRRLQFSVAAGIAVGLTLAGALFTHLYFVNQIDRQNARNQFLQTEIARLDRQLKEIEALEKTRQNLVTRMEIIQRLQESRPEIVRLFDELVVAIPEGVYLTKLDHKGRSVTIEGRAQSQARVSALMRNVEGSGWISRPRLMLIENTEKTGRGLFMFRLSFDQVVPKKPSKGEAPT